MPMSSVVTYKVLVLGEHKVGKTALVRRYSRPKDAFSHALLPTIGIDYVSVHASIDGLKLRVQIWDTVGQERFRTMTRLYYRGAKGIVLVYDVTNKETFEKVSEWIYDLKQYSLDNEVLFLVGNKTDLKEERCITTEQGRKLATSFGIKFFETSALTGDNVKETFQQLMVNMKDANNPFEMGSTHLIDGDEWEELFSKSPVIPASMRAASPWKSNEAAQNNSPQTSGATPLKVYERKGSRCCS